ncbi:chaperone protein dnaJ-related [Striga hermonthica]|uniref:Chaperone protein dnaJ-related n=1 Tax=Striga hermonthica TaxID=68872 RepID=A0A9N7RBJ8_STRHE|nr:chaperone protein dnaJ-related [Striga hermonthica]
MVDSSHPPTSTFLQHKFDIRTTSTEIGWWRQSTWLQKIDCRDMADSGGETTEELKIRTEMGSFYLCSAPPSSMAASKLQLSSKPLIFSVGGRRPERLYFPGNASYSQSKVVFRSSPRADGSADSNSPAGDSGPSNFCIIEGPETVQDFVQMQLQEIQDNIRSRRNRIFLLMEELRRLRVQQRIKSMEGIAVNENEMPDIPSSIPFLPHVTPKTLKRLYLTSFSFISGIIILGGLVAPILELKMGLGGTSYEDFIRNMHLPMQLSQVDPIVASFSGGAVGVISALMLIEINNVEQQEKKRCKYCHGTGYLACARCSASGLCLSVEPIISSASDSPLRAPTTKRCPNCSGAGKVMCPTCLCTGMMMASEHDPRIEPFD